MNDENPRIIAWSEWEDPMVELSEIIESDEDDDSETFPAVMSPLGIVPLTDFSSFNFILGETNFDITSSAAQIINAIPGVEVLDILTRYKFRISCGNLFDPEEVCAKIEESLDAIPFHDCETCEHCGGIHSPENDEDETLDPSINKQIRQLIDKELSKSPYWAMYQLPNGKIVKTTSEELTPAFKQIVNVYKLGQEKAGGEVFFSVLS